MTQASPRSFDKTRRLRRRGEFQKVFDGGQRVRGRYLTILLTPRQTGPARLGIVASKKIGNAIRRNRAKRLIREIFRHSANPGMLERVDIVVIPRAEIADASFKDVQHDYTTTISRCAARARTQTHGRS